MEDDPIRLTDPDGMAPVQSGGEGDKDGPSKETTTTAVLSVGLQFKTDIKLFGLSVGIEANIGSMDVIGVRDNKFVFMETKTTQRSVGIDIGFFGAKAEQSQVDKPLKNGATERTYTNTKSFSIYPKSDGVEEIKKGTDGVNVPNAGERKTTSKKTTHKTTYVGFSAAALLGVEFSRDETTKSENKIKKPN